MSREGIRITRPVDQASQQAIGSLAQSLARMVPDGVFERREPEKLGQTLVGSGECRLYKRGPDSIHPSVLYDQIRKKFHPHTAFDTLTLPVVGVEYLSRNSLEDTAVALILDGADIIRERRMYTGLIDGVIGESMPWKRITPHVSIGRVRPEYATNEFIERAREHAKPIGTITLNAIHTTEGPLIPRYRNTNPVSSEDSSLEGMSLRRIDPDAEPNPSALQLLRTMGIQALSS